MEYSGLNAKIKAMRGRLLSYNDFESLASLNTVESVGLRLKENPSYKDALNTLDGNALTRGNIEHRLFLSLLYDFSRIYKFINGFSYKKYVGAYVLRYEINILQLLLSIVFDERNISYMFPDTFDFLKNMFEIDVQKLSASENVPKFIENLQGTQYYPVLEGAYTSQTSLFEMETKLDVYYYIHLWRLQNKYLDKNNKKVLSKINGDEIDLRNLMWLYRLKKYYNMNTSGIYGYLIPVQHSMPKKQLMQMAEAKSESEFLSEFMNTKYGESLLKNGEIEKNFSLIMSRLYKSAELKDQNSLAPLASYLHSKSREIVDLTKLIECVRYNLNPGDIMLKLYISLKRPENSIRS